MFDVPSHLKWSLKMGAGYFILHTWDNVTCHEAEEIVRNVYNRNNVPVSKLTKEGLSYSNGFVYKRVLATRLWFHLYEKGTKKLRKVITGADLLRESRGIETPEYTQHEINKASDQIIHGKIKKYKAKDK